MHRFILVFLFVACCFGGVFAQAGQSFSANTQGGKDTIHPKSSLIGEDEQHYEYLSMEHQTSLLTVCEQDMTVAFNKWVSMLQEMEAYADLIEYDLKGLKLWLNIFWDDNGKIHHIAFHPKPVSRNTDIAELKAFFSSFMNHYTFPLAADTKYSHYGSATFPLHFQRKVTPVEDKPLVGEGH